MKSFLKYVLATVVGIIVSSILLFLVLIILLVTVASKQEKTIDVKPNSILYINFDRPIVDRQPVSPFNLERFSRDYRLGLNQILAAIESAKTDNNILGIYIETKAIDAGYASIDEIREALNDFRESDKFVVFYSDFISQKAYYLATASDKIFFNPVGMFMLNGVKVKTNHYKKALEKLGIEPVIVKAGDYKGATESMSNDKMSEPNREQLLRLINSYWENIGGEIARARNINTDTLNSAMNNLSLKSPEDVLAMALVDSLLYKGQVIDYLKNITNTSAGKDINSIKIDDYSETIGEFGEKANNSNKIAFIYASGVILDGDADEDNIGGEKYARLIRKARRDSTVKAIVIRVNSPGGSALASEVILDEISRTKGVKPIVISMGDVAASGGYYISCNADSIIAGKNTITGSIGVYFRAAYSEKLFENLGITFDMVKTHGHTDMYSITRPYTSEEIAYLQYSINATYDLFKNRVSNGRDLSPEKVEEIAQGRVWSGYDALGEGLIDSYGGITKAIHAASYLAGITDNYTLEEWPQQETAIEKLMKDFTGETKVEAAFESLGLDKGLIRSLKNELKCQGLVTAMPYSIEVE